MITLMDNYLLLVALVVLVPEPVSMTDTHKLINDSTSVKSSPESLIKCGLCYSTRCPRYLHLQRRNNSFTYPFLHSTPTLTHELIPTLTH